MSTDILDAPKQYLTLPEVKAALQTQRVPYSAFGTELIVAIPGGSVRLVPVRGGSPVPIYRAAALAYLMGGCP